MKNIYISSCTKDGGVYHYLLNENGKLEYIDKLAVDCPMYQIYDGKKMYILLRAPFESNDDSGLICAEVDGYSLVNKTEPVTTKGRVACHLCKSDNDIYCVNYVSGSVIKMPDKLCVHEGKGVDPIRQESAHTHFVTLTPDKRYVLVTDLGLDKIFIYTKDLELVGEINTPKGHGVRHLVFSDDGKTMFAVNELASTISAFSYDGEQFKLIDTVSILALPQRKTGKSLSIIKRWRNMTKSANGMMATVLEKLKSLIHGL